MIASTFLHMYGTYEKIRQNCTDLVNYVYLLASSRGNTLHHLINNVCGSSVGITKWHSLSEF